MEDSIGKKLIPFAVVAGLFGAGILASKLKRKAPGRHEPHTTKPTNLPNNEKTLLPILQLPQQVRRVLWRTLPYEDLLQLRLVCKSIKEDIDTFVGLKMNVTARNKYNYELAQEVLLTECVITDVVNDVEEDFFLDPFALRSLKIIEKSPISVASFENLIYPCKQLQSLKLHLFFSQDVANISQVLLNTLCFSKSLKKLKVYRMSLYPFEDRLFNFEILSSTSLSTNLTYIDLQIPDVPVEHLGYWKFILDSQINLRVLIVNLGAVHWKYFHRVIKRNINLEKVGLLAIKSFHHDRAVEEPFDWSIFEDLERIKSLEVWCPRTSGNNGQEIATSINFSRLPAVNLEELHVHRVLMTPEDVAIVYLEMKNLKSGSLNHIGDAGTARANELAWLHHNQDEDESMGWLSEESYVPYLINSLLAAAVVTSLIVASKKQKHFLKELFHADENS